MGVSVFNLLSRGDMGSGRLNDPLIPPVSFIPFLFQREKTSNIKTKTSVLLQVFILTGVWEETGGSTGLWSKALSLLTVPCRAFSSFVGPLQIVFTFLKDVSPLEACE